MPQGGRQRAKDRDRHKKVFFATAIKGNVRTQDIVDYLTNVLGDTNLQTAYKGGFNIANQLLSKNMQGKEQENGKRNPHYHGHWYRQNSRGEYCLDCEHPESLESRCRFLREAKIGWGRQKGAPVFTQEEIRNYFRLCCENDSDYKDKTEMQAKLKKALGLDENDNKPSAPAAAETPEEKKDNALRRKLLKSSYQLILTGAPGTGKTWSAVHLAENWIEETGGTTEKNLCQVQFHPGYDYSDFIIGIKPAVKDGEESGSGPVTFFWKDGIFKEFSDKAKKERESAEKESRPAKPYIFIIDEINRADLSRVFGEVFSLLEEEYRYPNRKTGIKLPSGDEFILPDNLYIIGTMNDIDRSVESMDFALRRRFAWHEVKAEDSVHIIDAADKEGKKKIPDQNDRDKLKSVMKTLNGYIGSVDGEEPRKLTVNGQTVSLNLGDEYELGGAYFLNFAKYNGEENPQDLLWNNHIAVILNEYLRVKKNRTELLSLLKQKFDETWNQSQ